MSRHAEALRALLAQPGCIGAPGIYDALSGLIAVEAGFPALFLSGGMLSFTRYARPDIGLVSMTEVADQVALIRERLPETPLFVDADTGWGNALNVQRTVVAFERAGASAIQLEDQVTPKRCGHMAGKAVIPAAEMVGKLKAALDARRDPSTLIIGRTDALAPEGWDKTLERCHAYVEAGCDILFLEGPQTVGQMQTVARAFGGRVPLMHNLVEGGVTPVHSLAELEAIGYDLGLFPGTIVFSILQTMRTVLADLHAEGDTRAHRDRMVDIAGMNAAVGTPEMMALGEKYAG